MTNKQRVGAVSATLLAACLGLAYLLVVRPFANRGRQLSSLVRMEAIERQLADFRATAHRYPGALTELPSPREPDTDSFGHRFLYLSDGSGFVLVGLGAGGRPDGTNYLLTRASGGSASGDCRDAGTDLIVSDRGWHRRCGK